MLRCLRERVVRISREIPAPMDQRAARQEGMEVNPYLEYKDVDEDVHPQALATLLLARKIVVLEDTIE